ncbi:MAG: hypothetical protein CBC57_05880 [Euryarchaeota archaeon TMED97]|nr:MAG: hypothetical protein CBC57_05880 [Euryarchaeota archaeon TMED97]
MAYQGSKLTAVPYFYDKQLRRYIQQFIRIFAGFQVAMHSDSAGNVVYQTAPVRYGDVSRMAAHIVRENSENMIQTTPFISCHVTGLETAPDRRTLGSYEETVPVYEKKFNEDTGSYENEQGRAYSIKRHQPVPYNLTMQVDVWTSNTEQKLQLLEQILVLFNPTLNIHTSNNPLDWSTLSYVELIASTWSMRAIPSGVDDIIDISTMTFTMPVLINPPAKVTKQTIIHTIIDNINDTDEAGLEALRAGNSFVPLFTSHKVVTLDNFKMRFTMDASGNGTAQLLSQSGTNSDANGILNWATVFKPFGEFRNDISQLRLKQTDDPSITSGDIIGNIKINQGDPNLLDITMDTSTFPTNTQTAVDAVVDPQANFPGDGTITAAQDGDRYLLTKDVAGGVGWLGSNAKKHDIIQYSIGTNQWDIVFDASVNGSTVQHTTNTTTADRLKYNGAEWVNAFEGTYNPGFWRIYL